MTSITRPEGGAGAHREWVPAYRRWVGGVRRLYVEDRRGHHPKGGQRTN